MAVSQSKSDIFKHGHMREKRVFLLNKTKVSLMGWTII